MIRWLLPFALAGCGPVMDATEWSDAMPPQRFRGDGVATVFFLSRADVTSICSAGRSPPAGGVVLACSTRKDGRRIVVMPNPCPAGEAGDYWAQIMCHENGHLEGWTGQHEE